MNLLLRIILLVLHLTESCKNTSEHEDSKSDIRTAGITYSPFQRKKMISYEHLSEEH